MAGLTAIASVGKKPSSTQFLEIVSQSLRGALTIKEIESNPFCQSALSSTSDSSGSSAESIERGVKIIVDGYFIETLGCKISSASFFLDEYLKSGLKSVNKLNGSFNIIIINNKEIKVTVISDRYGTRPLFYYRNTESLALSYSSSMLIDLGITKKTLNMDMVANHLSYSRVWLNDETFFKGIYSVPRSAIISWSETSGVVESFYSNEESKISFDGSASVEGLAELLK